jgi:hypothetical protein
MCCGNSVDTTTADLTTAPTQDIDITTGDLTTTTNQGVDTTTADLTTAPTLLGLQ